MVEVFCRACGDSNSGQERERETQASLLLLRIFVLHCASFVIIGLQSNLLRKFLPQEVREEVLAQAFA